MKTFRIDYIDPADGAAKSMFVRLEEGGDSPAITRAEDYAFTIARDGYYTVTPVDCRVFRYPPASRRDVKRVDAPE